MFNAEKVKNECVQWIRDFFEKNGKDCNAVVGISGGKDSSVVAALCVEALGRDRVSGVLMPCGEQHDIDMAKLLVETLEDIEGALAKAEKQDDSLSTYAPMISKEDGHLNFSMTPEELERRMRAYDPWPGTFAEMNGKTYKLWRAQALEDSTDAPAGTVVAAGKEGLDISAGGRLLRVTQIQAPGKKRMNTGDYLRGNLIEIGTVMR